MMNDRQMHHAAIRILLALCAVVAIPMLAMSAPRVLRTIPQNGDNHVDAGLGEIRVEFDSDMQADGYSFVGGGPSFPKPMGQARWLDQRTCVLPVQLEPDHDYSFSINSERFTKFRGADGAAAVPMPVAFHTAGRPDAAPLSPEQSRAVISELRRAIDEHYSYRDRRGLDWDDLFLKNRSALEEARTSAALAAAVANVLRAADQPNGFSKPIDRVLTPAKEGRPRFRGKVAVLQGRFTLSSAESFVLMMKQVPRCITVGDTTYGSSGNPQPYDLGDGITIHLPSWKDMDAKGHELEGVGIAPDVVVGADPDSLKTGDPIIAKAHELLLLR